MTTELLNLMPPQAIEAEEGLLGGLLFDSGAIMRIINVLEPEHFYINAHGHIYRAICALYRENKPTDLMHVIDWLTAREFLEKIGGQSKLVQLVDRTVTAVNIDGLANLIVEKFVRRQLIKVGNDIVQLGYQQAEDIQDLVDQAQSKVFAVREQLVRDDEAVERLSDILPTVFEEIQSANLGEDAIFQSLPTQFYDVDEIITGLPIGSLSIAGGRAGMGKTTWAVELAIKSASVGLPVLFFSLEMTKAQIVKKILGRMAAPDVFTKQLFDRNALTDADWEPLSRVLGTASDLPLWIRDASSPTISDIRSDIQKVKSAEGNLSLVVIDYVGLMRLERGSKGGNRVQELDIILADLRAIAKGFNTSVLGLAQINRGVEARQNKRPTLGDFRESGAYEQEGAVIMGLYNDAYYNPDSVDRGIAEVIILKNRFGATGTAPLLFQPEYGRFLNLAR